MTNAPPWKNTRTGSAPARSFFPAPFAGGRYIRAPTPVLRSMTTSLDVTPVASSTPAGTRSVPSIRWTRPLLYSIRNGEKSNATMLSGSEAFTGGDPGGNGLRW
ncbi:Os09g0462000 [Oryza sativa Japonica Group]|uniref:Os09g0462000 protein n=1 Tax=Oryza sativa subsp. japonica TaxID=39947 RepID=Q67IZ4_ORYSJ|nr:unknown protein [Oryza sativa Japonica Group]BAF25313.1 Os09g0462000 [Oryza sativa Japonica Group]|eukprot:NP_001063399.1 Os09g0462000 [Oryza sativa Japonica Group]